jgi:hypothetical protein
MEDDAAAVAAVAAVRSAQGNEFFPAERQAATAAVAGLDINFYFIDNLPVRYPFGSD